MKRECGNCGNDLSGELAAAPCIAEAMGGVLMDRGVSEKDVKKLLSNLNGDAFWNDVGRVVDRLEDGEYSV